MNLPGGGAAMKWGVFACWYGTYCITLLCVQGGNKDSVDQAEDAPHPAHPRRDQVVKKLNLFFKFVGISVYICY